jgi:hypothetical protein
VYVAERLANLGEEQFDRKRPHPVTGLTHRRHRNAAFGCEVVIVVTNHDQIIWHSDTKISCRLNNTDG